VAGTLITTWLVPAMTHESYAPIFILVAALVPASLLALWLVTGRVEKIHGPVERR
jgi:ACS family hexuronate transporter-like MFS transporter